MVAFSLKTQFFLTEKAKDFLRSSLGFNGDPMLNLISRCVGVNLICVLGTSCNYQFEIMLLKSSLAIMMVWKGDGRFLVKTAMIVG